MPDAIDYTLYRSTNMFLGYTQVYDGSGTTFTDTGLTAGKRYFYKVCYFRGGIYNYSWLSPVAAGVTMGKTSITSITSPTKGQVRLVWSKAAAASGYQVLMSTSSNGVFKSVRALTGTTVTFTGLTSGSSLYFKVRPYTRIYTNTYYGLFSMMRSIKVK